jgi:hypothetical protein
MQDVSEAYITIESKEDGAYFEAPVTKGKMVRLGDEYRKLPADLILNIQACRLVIAGESYVQDNESEWNEQSVTRLQFGE